MITEKELKKRCTPEFFKWCVDLAEGFEIKSEACSNVVIVKFEHIEWIFMVDDIAFHPVLFPLLIHRAVERWNRRNERLLICSYMIVDYNNEENPYDSDNYLPDTLTALECAMLDCLLNIFEAIDK